MRRSPIVLTATVAGTAGVLAFHPHAAAVQSAAPSPTATTSTSTSRTATSSSGTSSGSGSGSGTRSSGSSSTSAISGTATGDAVATRYGNGQVRVTVRNGRIVDIEALELTGDDPHSAQISASAEPTLKQEALTKQSADIDAVSGATYTSAAYAQSLQSALDKVHFKAPDGSRATLQVG